MEFWRRLPLITSRSAAIRFALFADLFPVVINNQVDFPDWQKNGGFRQAGVRKGPAAIAINKKICGPRGRWNGNT
jgi:hypothetical protein